MAGRYVFFNHSAFDGNDPAANASDDLAVAPSIVPLLPGQAPSAANVSGYVRGVNGVMIDVRHLARDTVSADDFDLRVGNDGSDPAAWPAAPAPTSVAVRRGAGVDGSDRVTLAWAGGAVRDAWLRVKVLDNLDTGLPAPDAFSFGSLAGESGASGLAGAAADLRGSTGGVAVTSRDLAATRRRLSGPRAVGVDSPVDHNRDGRVNALDVAAVRYNLFSRLERPAAALLPPTYYVSPAGDDAGDGLSPLSAWRTVAKVNSTSLPPGAHVLFERGGEWRENLLVSSSGTAKAPVVFGSYGTGLKPKFWGSDVLDAARFEPVEGTASTYRMVAPGPAGVNSIHADHAFFRSAFLATGRSAEASRNLEFVHSTARSWYQDADGVLYVNTGGVDPRAGAVLYTAAVRENVVYVHGAHDVVVRNLVVDECAKWTGGYGFAVGQSQDVTVEGCEAYRAGRHHFGVIDSDNFVGRELYSAWAQPDQGYGLASAYVSYTGARDLPAPTRSTWVDCAYDELDSPTTPYMSFYTHGEGMGDVLVQNVVSHGGIGMSMATDGVDQNIRVIGGLIDNGNLSIWGDNVVVDGITVRGPKGAVQFAGNGNVVQNSVIDVTGAGTGTGGGVVIFGKDNTLRFSTVRIGPGAPGHAAAIVVSGAPGNGAGTGTRIYGNVIDSAMPALRMEGDAPVSSLVYADQNLYAHEPWFRTADDVWMPLAQWQASTGLETTSRVADPLFVDVAAGNFGLLPGSPARDAFVASDVLVVPLTDLFGTTRPQGAGADLGAVEAVLSA